MSFAHAREHIHIRYVRENQGQPTSIACARWRRIRRFRRKRPFLRFFFARSPFITISTTSTSQQDMAKTPTPAEPITQSSNAAPDFRRRCERLAGVIRDCAEVIPAARAWFQQQEDLAGLLSGLSVKDANDCSEVPSRGPATAPPGPGQQARPGQAADTSSTTLRKATASPKKRKGETPPRQRSTTTSGKSPHRNAAVKARRCDAAADSADADGEGPPTIERTVDLAPGARVTAGFLSSLFQNNDENGGDASGSSPMKRCVAPPALSRSILGRWRPDLGTARPTGGRRARATRSAARAPPRARTRAYATIDGMLTILFFYICFVQARQPARRVLYLGLHRAVRHQTRAAVR